jgi:hypothetical protein
MHDALSFDNSACKGTTFMWNMQIILLFLRFFVWQTTPATLAYHYAINPSRTRKRPFFRAFHISRKTFVLIIACDKKGNKKIILIIYLSISEFLRTFVR